jgi:hypothetical protein
MSFRPLTREPIGGSPDRTRFAIGASTRVLSLLTAAAASVAVLLLFAIYDRLSASAPITADSANAVLQGQAMAKGNLLLQGWTLSGASFYVTDLPFYALFAAARGLSPAVAHEAGAVIYALLVVTAAFLARGRARGADALGPMAVTLMVLIAPAPGQAVQLLLLGPFHAGTTLLLLLALLVLDAARDRLLGLAAFGLLLALAVLSDALALYVGVVPAVLVAGIRLARRQVPSGPEKAVLAVTVLSVPTALAMGWALQGLGAFATVPLQGSFVDIENLPRNVALTIHGVLLLFGADFFGMPLATTRTIPVLLHLAGVAFVLASWRWAVRDWGRAQADRVTQMLVMAMAVDLGAYLFSNQAIDLNTSRYLIPFLAFGAVIAGRVGAARLGQGRRRAAAAAIAVAYGWFLVTGVAAAPGASHEAELGAFLQQHQLRYGLAGYWQASPVTVETDGRVQVRAVDFGEDLPSPYLWEAEGGWYDPDRAGNDARFVLRDMSDRRSVDRSTVVAAFGQPVEEYHVAHWEVLVWHRNLLMDLNT